MQLFLTMEDKLYEGNCMLIKAIKNQTIFLLKQKEAKESSFTSSYSFAMANTYAFTPLYSSETVSFFLPLARRAANTLRPFAVAILSRKPCLFFLFLLEG